MLEEVLEDAPDDVVPDEVPDVVDVVSGLSFSSKFDQSSCSVVEPNDWIPRSRPACPGNWPDWPLVLAPVWLLCEVAAPGCERPSRFTSVSRAPKYPGPPLELLLALLVELLLLWLLCPLLMLPLDVPP